ncbi:MAG: lysozyme [Rhodospirillaceae bacterium]|nr:MAG: lysozyme [Rhodospirillaceae bacterium]
MELSVISPAEIASAEIAPVEIAPAGLAIIEEYEGCHLTAYLCPAGIPTIGYGHTGPDVTMQDVGRRSITKVAAEALLESDLRRVSDQVAGACRVSANANQHAAMVSLAFNIGIGNFRKSTVLNAHNRGDTQAAGRAFNLWTKATVRGRKGERARKVELPGLVSRRAREAALYLSAVRPEDRTAMPQGFIEEPPMRASPGVAGGGIAAGAGSLAATAEIARQVGDIGYAASPLVDLALRVGPVVLALAAVAAIGWVVYRQMRLRRDGWL